MQNVFNAGAIAFLVAAPDTKTKRVNITVPESHLEAIDTYARQHKMSRSAFLLEAAKRAMTGENRV